MLHGTPTPVHYRQSDKPLSLVLAACNAAEQCASMSDYGACYTQARGALMLQEPTSVRFLHVAMLQHDPEGRIAFMHRTAEGKFFPNRCSAKAHTLSTQAHASH